MTRSIRRRPAAHFSASYPNVTRALKVLGKRRISRTLGISIAHLNGALCDEQTLPPNASARARDLEAVLARAYEIMRPEVIVDWLEGTEPTLGFGRPIDALPVVGKTPLLAVLDRIAAGGYA